MLSVADVNRLCHRTPRSQNTYCHTF